MKKILLIMTAVLMVFGAVGNAAAYFETDSGHIIMSIYQEDGKEVGIDLGDGDSLVGASAGTMNLGHFEPGTTWDQLNMGIWGQDFSFSEIVQGTGFYYATTTDADPGFSLNGIGGFDASNNLVMHYYNGLTTGNVAVGETSHVLSYDYKFNAKSNAPGSYAFTKPPTTAPGETDLAAIATGDSVTMYLHKYALDGEVFVYAGNTAITLNADGSVTTSAVPVPGAIYLMGTALVAFFGVRRRRS